MAGLAKICRAYGSLKVRAANGKTATWIWDEVTGKPKLKTTKKKKQNG